MIPCKIILSLFLSVSLIFTASGEAGLKKKKSETFKVWGNCGVCESKIEKSLKIKGVSKAEWNKETKMMTVVFNPDKISLAEIHRKIAAEGYDTEMETATDEAYDNLHGCCKYKRKNK